MVVTLDSVSCTALMPSAAVPSSPVEYRPKKFTGSDSRRIQTADWSVAVARPSSRSAAMFITADSRAAMKPAAITSRAPSMISCRCARATNVPRIVPVMTGTSRPSPATSAPASSSRRRSRRFPRWPKRSSAPTPRTFSGSGA